MPMASYTTNDFRRRTCWRSLPPAPRLLVVGVGNELLSDDGFGIHAIRALQQQPVSGVTMVELGTAILHGLEFLEAADRVLVLDAAKGGQLPGTIYLFEASAAPPDIGRTSIHALGLCEAAKLLLGLQHPPITVLGVEPSVLDYGFDLSPPVRSALPRVVRLSRQTLAGWKREGVCQKASTLRADATVLMSSTS